MKAGILAVGTELLMGQTVNTNASELSRALAECGVGVYYHYTVGDNEERMAEHLKALMRTCDLVVTTGGLGPTQDDITKEVLAKVLGVEMVLDAASLTHVKARFKKFNRTMPKSNIRQAYFPEGAIVLENAMGTAPACLVEADECTVVVLPGPPREMRYVLETHLVPYLKAKTAQQMYSKYLSIYDMGESTVEEKLMTYIESQTDPTLATYAGDGKVLLRVTASSGDYDENVASVEAMVACVKERIGAYVVSDSGASLQAVLIEKLRAKGQTIAFAESCTGGKIAASLIENSGASDVVHSGVVSYSNDAKIRFLDVSEGLLSQCGAVSPEVCKAMVEGILKATGATVGVAVTGIAGPGGGSEEKPVGLVYIGVGTAERIEVSEHRLYGDRVQIQDRVVVRALKQVYDTLV